MDYTEFIKPELLALVIALYGLGCILKGTEKVPNNYIPVILTAAGILLACLYIFGTDGITPVSIFTAIVQGILIAAAAVYGNQIIKQMGAQK